MKDIQNNINLAKFLEVDYTRTDKIIEISKTKKEEKPEEKIEKKKICLASPHMGTKEMKYIKEAFESNWIAPLGHNVEAFEREVAEYINIQGALALSSGTAAIHLALRLLGVTRGDLVFCSTLTFVASCNPIIYEGAEPVFIDSEPESFNMSPLALEKAFKYYEEKGKRPKALIVVHLYGQCADMDKIKALCNAYEVPIIEDAAEALGSTYKGQFAGTLGDYGIFSFNGNKIITTSGGGMLVSRNREDIKKALFWATQAKDSERYYQHSELGFNYRLSNIAAGIGRGQMRVLEDRINQKRSIFKLYDQAFKDIKAIAMEPICDYGTSNCWLSVITIDKTSSVKPLEVILALEKENIEARFVWKPMHLQPFYKTYDFFSHNEVGISVSEDIFLRGVCLPSDTKMNIEDQVRVIEVVKELF